MLLRVSIIIAVIAQTLGARHGYAQLPIEMANSESNLLTPPPKLSAHERLILALYYPGAAHYSTGQSARGNLFLGLTSTTLVTGLALVTTGYVKELAYRESSNTPTELRESANQFYSYGNTWLMVSASLWVTSVLDAWLGESRETFTATKPVSKFGHEATNHVGKHLVPSSQKASALSPQKSSQIRASEILPSKNSAQASREPKPNSFEKGQNAFPHTQTEPKIKPTPNGSRKDQAGAHSNQGLVNKEAPVQAIVSEAKQDGRRVTSSKNLDVPQTKSSNIQAENQAEYQAENQAEYQVKSDHKVASNALSKKDKVSEETPAKVLSPMPPQITEATLKAGVKKEETSVDAPLPKDNDDHKKDETIKQHESASQKKNTESEPPLEFEFTPKGRFSIQLKAFRGEEVAKRFLKRLSKSVTPLRIFAMSKDGKPVYRLRLGRFEKKESAIGALKILNVLNVDKIDPIIVRAEK